MQTGKVVPVKQKQRKTKTQKKKQRALQFTKGGSAASAIIAHHLERLQNIRTKLATIRSMDLKEVKAPKDLQESEWVDTSDLTSPMGELKEDVRAATYVAKRVLNGEEEFKERVLYTKELLMAASGGKGMRFSLRIVQQQPLNTNSANGKYIQFFAGSPNYSFASLANATEFTNLDVLFDEVFIHGIKITCKAMNLNVIYGGTGGATGNAQSCMGLIYFLPHNTPGYADGSTIIQTAMVTNQHKLIDFGRDWEFHVKNPDRFDWEGDVMDMTTAFSGMGWCSFPQVSTKYGGNVYIVTAIPTAAAATISAFPSSTLIGHLVYEYDISVRARS